MHRTSLPVATALNLSAPILPGEGAAGIHLGAPVGRLFEQAGVRGEEIISACLRVPTGLVRYATAEVEVHAEQGRAVSILLRAGYRGLLAERVAIGATIAQVRAACGPILAVADDEVTLPGHPGVVLYLRPESRGPRHPSFEAEPVQAILLSTERAEA